MPEPVATEPREFHQAMDDFIEFNDDDEPQRGPWIVPVLGIVVALGWICGMLWLSWPTVQQLAPIELTGFIAALCVPPALIGILLLLALRTSTAEARRFGRTHRAHSTHPRAFRAPGRVARPWSRALLAAPQRSRLGRFAAA